MEKILIDNYVKRGDERVNEPIEVMKITDTYYIRKIPLNLVLCRCEMNDDGKLYIKKETYYGTINQLLKALKNFIIHDEIMNGYDVVVEKLIAVNKLIIEHDLLSIEK